MPQCEHHLALLWRGASSEQSIVDLVGDEPAPGNTAITAARAVSEPFAVVLAVDGYPTRADLRGASVEKKPSSLARSEHAPTQTAGTDCGSEGQRIKPRSVPYLILLGQRCFPHFQ
jgi:hypothetical protein